MTSNELKNFIASNDVGLITFYAFTGTKDGPHIWEIYAYDHETEHNEAARRTVGRFGNLLRNSSREKEKKIYTSLDRAYLAIKKMGYKGKIEIDDSGL